MKTRDLVKIAMYVALYVAIDFATHNYLPKVVANGGSWGIATSVLIIASFDLGLSKAMMIVALCLGLEWWYGKVYFVSFGQYILDYIIAFMAYAFAKYVPKLTSNKESILYTVLPVLVVNLVRFISSTLSGIIYYGVDLMGSIEYQSVYMIPTAIAGLVLVPLLYKSLRPFFHRESQRA